MGDMDLKVAGEGRLRKLRAPPTEQSLLRFWCAERGRIATVVHLAAMQHQSLHPPHPPTLFFIHLQARVRASPRPSWM